MYNSVPVASGGLSALQDAADFRDVAAIGGRFSAYGREIGT